MNKTIVCVLIAQENLPYIREWCEHHLRLGFDSITLYDNTGSKGSTRISTVYRTRSDRLQKQKITKRGYPYTIDLPDKEASLLLRESVKDLPVSVLEWKPRDSNGDIIHGQVEAYVDYIRKNKHFVDWTAFIDADEYLSVVEGWGFDELLHYVGLNNTNRVYLKPKRYLCRELGHLKSYVQLGERTTGKNIIKIDKVVRADIHCHWFVPDTKCFIPDINTYWINHFNFNTYDRNILGDFCDNSPWVNMDCSISV